MKDIAPMQLPQQNRLLGALTANTQSRLFPGLELVYLARGEVIHESGVKPRYAYFPIDAIVANVATIENGASMEVTMIGNEGVLGIAFFMDSEDIPGQAIVQSAGHAYRLSGRRLREEFDRHGEMLVLLLRYTQALITQVAQTAMCNRHHAIDQQLCRWLLQSLDRLPMPDLFVTQESIANMLGVRRESVTEAVGKLKNLGLIECHRMRIRVLDRPGLEKRCCECYSVVSKEMARLLPGSAMPSRHQQASIVSGF